jgi:hypothetical protein
MGGPCLGAPVTLICMNLRPSAQGAYLKPLTLLWSSSTLIRSVMLFDVWTTRPTTSNN